MVAPPDHLDPTLPSAVLEMLRRGDRLDRISLDSDGNWWHEGAPITHPRIIALFHRSIVRTEGGTWVLRVGRFTHPITVEATGWFVERVDLGATPPRVFLSDGSDEALDLDSLRYVGDGLLLCRIHAGANEARFKRSAYYELAGLVAEEKGEWTLRLGNRIVRIGAADQTGEATGD